MASTNTQFSIAVHVLAALAHYETTFTSEVLAESVNANPVFVKRILVKLSKAGLVKTTLGKTGGYGLARSPVSTTLYDISEAIDPPDPFSIHAYEERKSCIVSNNIKDVMGDVLTSTQKAVKAELKRTTLADVVSKIRTKAK